MKHSLRLLLGSFACAASIAAPSAAQQRVAAQPKSAKAAARDFSSERLIAPPTNAWPTNGGNLYNQRYSPLDRINRSNVASLKGVWRARLRGSGDGTKYSGEAQITRRTLPTRIACAEESGSRPIRIAASAPSSTRLTMRSTNQQATLVSG